MNSLVVFLICISFTVLVLGFFAWKSTNSRGTILATAISSIGLLLASYHLASKQNPQMSVFISFLAGMLLGGRGIAWAFRSRKETELRLPSLFLIASSALCIVAFVMAYKYTS